MKREVERGRELPAFSLDTGEFEVLWHRLLHLFDDPSTVHASISIRIGSEKLEFDNVEELRQYKPLPARVANFSFWLSQSGHRISVRSHTLLIISRAQVSATSETEAWCAGAIDTVYTFVQSHRLWYNWFVAAPIGWSLIALINAPLLANIVVPSAHVDPVVIYAWLAAMCVLLLLYFGRGFLLPGAVLRLSEGTGFIRAHIPELSLAIAVVSAVLTVVGWFISK